MKKVHFLLFLLVSLAFTNQSFAADSVVKIEVVSDAAGLKYNIWQTAIDYVKATDGFKMLESGSKPDVMVKMAVASIKEDDTLVASAIAMVVVIKKPNGAKSISRFHNEVVLIADIENIIKSRMSEILGN
jgi:hypothetical protein